MHVLENTASSNISKDNKFTLYIQITLRNTGSIICQSWLQSFDIALKITKAGRRDTFEWDVLGPSPVIKCDNLTEFDMKGFKGLFES